MRPNLTSQIVARTKLFVIPVVKVSFVDSNLVKFPKPKTEGNLEHANKWKLSTRFPRLRA